MLKTIPFELLRIGDLVHVTSKRLPALLIRLKEMGPKRILDLSISTHTGMVMSLEEGKILAIAEMKFSGLKLNSFSDYLQNGFFSEHIISMTRHEALDDVTTQQKFKDELLRLWKEGKKYDIEGCLKFVFPFLKDKPKEAYCSELAEHMATFCGFSYYRAHPSSNDDVMPSTLQFSKYMTRIC